MAPISNQSFRRTCFLFLLALLTSVILPAQNGTDYQFAVLELFTSEGCSSCPPGEDALATLRSEADRQGLPLITIAWHVDYWDRLGWPDPYASRDATLRQRWYGDRLPSQLYTPQAIVDGMLIAGWAGNTSELRRLTRQ